MRPPCRQRAGLTQRFATGGLLALVAMLVPLAAAPQKQSPIQWRVEGGAAGLEPTAHVRLEVENAVPAASLSPRYGLVQVAVYLFQEAGPVATAVEKAAAETGLAVSADPEAADAGLRVTVEIPDLAPADAALALVMGRPVKVHGAREASSEDRRRAGALRADVADLEERLRWSADTLLPSGSQRVIWEGTVPLETDVLYADFLAVRGRGDATAPAATAEALEARPPGPDPGILDIPPTKLSHPPPLPSGTAGVTVTRASGQRRFGLALERGRLNIIRVRAVEDPTGSLGLELQVSHADLPSPAR